MREFLGGPLGTICMNSVYYIDMEVNTFVIPFKVSVGIFGLNRLMFHPLKDQ